jgi:hypothetical protein
VVVIEIFNRTFCVQNQMKLTFAKMIDVCCIVFA